ncbi:MAG: tetratricopeptide repeat protein [Planctomycetota bacterium]
MALKPSTIRSIVLVAALVPLTACSSTEEAAPSGDDLPHFRIGVVQRSITAASPDAQLWFDRGLAQCFGFNHDEAVACFERAAEIDSGCAMAYWGKAYALGPNYNSPAPDPAATGAAADALVRAAAELDDETDVERALVDALTARFDRPGGASSDRADLDRAYADAMRAVRARFPDDADVCALTGEAVMQLRPWGLWSPEGDPAPETPEIRSILEAGLQRWPDHPAMCHLYIHAMEAGPEVERSIPAAERLETLAPGLGHLVHMPSHSYVWTGRYADVIRTNRLACEVDDAFARVRGMDGGYTAYRIHNYHFVAYGAMWDGQRDLAMEYARAIPDQIPASLLSSGPDLYDVFHATHYHVMVRFGMWEELLDEPDPGEDLLATRAVWRYARAVALAALGRVDEAEEEQRAFEAARDAVPPSRVLFNNPVSEVLAVATAFLEGEIEYRKGNYDVAFASLRRAVELDEELNYDEPWGWMEPARHALGALLTEQGRYAEAVEVYEANLRRYPENGWALHGLAECLEASGRTDEAEEMRGRFRAAWARADVSIPGSCFCRTSG